ncbi:hypothetical protein BCY91_08310 [Pelobium manganitolerans]|uniref:Tetratricopeptide repeat protein n=1 Tax=Pelobium manganitolerans TaxID=1842495 RepID=A0A419S467_9SPHI|nr:hypothetical protein [Pelobium manganitolerans]RKD14464.1 hypothetical protein BCY91_08310 [Pelobium manganitolerans]
MDKFSEKDIVNYVDGEMDSAERNTFEAQLLHNQELQKEVALYRNIKATLQSHVADNRADAQFKNHLASLNKQYFNKQERASAKMRSLPWNKLWYVAAILVVGLLVWAPWNKNLYQQYSNTQMVSFAERGANDRSELQKATDAFNSGDFKKAKEILMPLLNNDQQNDVLRYYLGISQVETNEVKIGRINLSKVALGYSLLKYDATFYVALSYLKEKNESACKEWLHKIPSSASNYNKAQELLKKLN